MTQDSKTVPIARDRVEDTSSDIKASKKPKTSENLSFDFDPNNFLEGHFRLAALRSLAELQDYPDTTISDGEGRGKFGHGRKSPSMASWDAPQKTNSK